MKTIRFGIIGLGQMGREIASALARWCHLEDLGFRPEITTICDNAPALGRVDWFKRDFPTIQLVTTDYRELAGRGLKCATTLSPRPNRKRPIKPIGPHAQMVRLISTRWTHLNVITITA